MRKLIAALIAGLLLSLAAHAGEAQPVGDPAIEARVNKLAEDLRCLTCMGQSIADSHSDFSTDMRREIRDMLTQGKSDQDVMDFMVQRYGDFVLYKPPVKSSTWLLWGGPFVLLIVGLAVLVAKLRKRDKQIPAAELTSQEHDAAAKLLAGNDQPNETKP